MGKTGRNWLAVQAQFRNSAGAMKHRNAPRGGASNESDDLLAEYHDEMEHDDWYEWNQECCYLGPDAGCGCHEVK